MSRPTSQVRVVRSPYRPDGHSTHVVSRLSGALPCTHGRHSELPTRSDTSGNTHCTQAVPLADAYATGHV